MKKLINSFSIYKFYIFYFICILIVLRIIYSRYNFIFLKPDKYFYTPIVVLIFTLIYLFIIFYIIYMNKHYPDRDTFIKRFLHKNPKVRNILIEFLNIYNNVYSKPFIKLSHYLERYKIYKKIQSVGGSSYRSSLKFQIALKEFNFKDITFIDFLSFLFQWSMLSFCIFTIVNIYYFHILSYKNLAIFFIYLAVRRIMRYWYDRLWELKEEQWKLEEEQWKLEEEQWKLKQQQRILGLKENLTELINNVEILEAFLKREEVVKNTELYNEAVKLLNKAKKSIENIKNEIKNKDENKN